MNVIVWGCRGTIASPGPSTIRYGGESTCIEVRTDNGEAIIIDAGSGIRKLGQQLLKDPSITHISFLLTHSHWDHLAGFPLFQPAYYSRYSFSLCGGSDPLQSVVNYLQHQMVPPYFPVNFTELKARFESGCCCNIAPCGKKLPYAERSTICESIPLNHPNGGFGFKLSSTAGSFVFLTDNEIRYAHQGGLPREAYVRFCKNAGLLFHDAQYIETEYERTRGWGHSTVQDALDLAIDADVQRLGLCHHDPDRTDDQLDQLVEECRTYIKEKGSVLECFACAEGMKLVV
jgi:phosphoribosyl 1,2-cyclic phosphodiesterase